MTARELIERLQAVLEANPEVANAEVSTEGCDCFGDAARVSVEVSTEGRGKNKRQVQYVMIWRQ